MLGCGGDVRCFLKDTTSGIFTVESYCNLFLAHKFATPRTSMRARTMLDQHPFSSYNCFPDPVVQRLVLCRVYASFLWHCLNLSVIWLWAVQIGYGHCKSDMPGRYAMLRRAERRVYTSRLFPRGG